MEAANASGCSTLVLVNDAEFVLSSTHRQVVFDRWDGIEAKDKKRVLRFQVSLTPHHRLSDSVPDHVAAVPLVLTAPFTPQFSLQSTTLLTLLRADAGPLEFAVTFQPPAESDVIASNFQDQIIIQTRLARLCIRLLATHSTDDFESAMFAPPVLPSTRAPALRLFDQIERDALAGSSISPRIPSQRLRASTTFHPSKNADNTLAPIPQRPVHHVDWQEPPSRPSSASSVVSGRRTASPRVLEPLVTPPEAPGVSVTTDVSNQLEARAVILRLRARRVASQSSPVIEPSQDQPTCPESRVDAKAKAELEEFNALVKAAKLNVAREMTKAKQELDYYKSILPPQPTVEATPTRDPIVLAAALPSKPEKAATIDRKKPARLPTLVTPSDSSPVVSNSRATPSSNQNTTVGNNQELSPIKSSKPRPAPVHHSTVVVKEHVKPQRQVQPDEPQERASTKPPPPTSTTVKSRRSPSSSSPPVSTPTVKADARKTTVKPTAPAMSDAGVTKSSSKPSTLKRPSKPTVQATPLSVVSDAMLADFDDPDPEIDDAPVLPPSNNLRSRQEQDEDDEDFLRMLWR